MIRMSAPDKKHENIHRRYLGMGLGIGCFILLLVLPDPDGMPEHGMEVAAVALLMAVWWISEAVPIPVTALIPIIFFPFLGVMKTQHVTLAYANHLIYLFLGGFLIAMAMEKWNLHKRIALRTIRWVGVSPNRIVLGFMLATAFLSMWISNTATAMMMVTIGLAVIKQSGDWFDENDAAQPRASMGFGTVLMLAIAYSASIGGVATLIGTPPNAILAGVIEKTYGITIHFLDWMIFALPLSCVMLLLAWFYLTRMKLTHANTPMEGGRLAIEQELAALGPISKPEKWVLGVFLAVAIGWIGRGLLDWGALDSVSDASIAMAGAFALFIIPVNLKRGEFLLDWQSAVKLPWDIIILFGGGFALAEGFSSSGLTTWIAGEMALLEDLPLVIFIGTIVLLVVFLTEVTSNTATATLLLPVMGALAIAMNVHPLLAMTAAAIAASFAFMLPVATPPNAIAFSSRVITIAQMAKTGVVLNLIAVVVVTVFVMQILPIVMEDTLKGGLPGD